MNMHVVVQSLKYETHPTFYLLKSLLRRIFLCCCSHSSSSSSSSYPCLVSFILLFASVPDYRCLSFGQHYVVACRGVVRFQTVKQHVKRDNEAHAHHD